jgi:hypothetical protein
LQSTIGIGPLVAATKNGFRAVTDTANMMGAFHFVLLNHNKVASAKMQL